MRCFEVDLNHILKIRLLNCETLVPPRYHITRYLSEHIMYVMLDGELFLEENGRDLKLCQGDIYIFKKGDYQKPLKSTFCKYYYIHFETDLFTEYEMDDEEYYNAVKEKRMGFFKASKFNSDSDNFIKVILRQENKIENKGFFDYFVSILENNAFAHGCWDIEKYYNVSNVFTNLLLKLESVCAEAGGKNVFGSNSKTYKNVLRIAEYIGKNYMYNISSRDVERAVFLNYDYANRIFKKIMGVSIMKYCNFLRINEAKEIMNISDCTLDEIAEEIGFQDRCYFTRVFKKFEGITPEKYRKQKML